MLDMLMLAAEAAKPNRDKLRRAMVGACAIRSDGTVVYARNGSAQRPEPSCHAEARLLRKCDRGSKVFVARVLKNGMLAMAKPCRHCMARLRSKGVQLVAFTVGPDEYQVISSSDESLK